MSAAPGALGLPVSASLRLLAAVGRRVHRRLEPKGVSAELAAAAVSAGLRNCGGNCGQVVVLSGTAAGVRTVGRYPDGWCPPLQEPVVWPAATGRVPPLPVGAGELALEPVAELGAHQGHGRPL